MGHRLTKIYTRTGDDGTTGLGDGTRTAKNAPRIAAMGDVDELNSLIGLLAGEVRAGTMAGLLRDIQHGLFDLGGELSIPGSALVTNAYVERLERSIDELNASLPPLKNFILPGGSRAAAICHLCRSVCRRAERSVVAISRSESRDAANEHGRVFLNRLSDLLFVLARMLARGAGGKEVLWESGRMKKVTSHKLQVTSTRRRRSKRSRRQR
jgi:cob(I)alamin adenosyltransferase